MPGLALGQATDRGLLWRVVQTCIANARITGGAFPCLDVNLSPSTEAGFAVVRAPFDTTHVVLVPTARIIGVESPRLQAPDAVNYFEAAWKARRFVEDKAPHPLAREDVGLALNSRPGRSQDQLHIHVDCLDPNVKTQVRQHQSDLRLGTWTRFPVPLHGDRYWALRVKSADLQGVNVFQLVEDGLHVAEADRPRVTIVLAGTSFDRKDVVPDKTTGSDKKEPGFVIFAALAPDLRRLSGGHGEHLLNHSCATN